MKEGEIDGAAIPSRRRMPADAIAIAALVGVHVGFFWRAILLRGYLIHSDICYFFDPVKVLLHESLRAGRLPLWSPYLFCGYPIAAEGQIAAFYPVSLLISYLLPSPAAINWLIVLHLLLAAVSMYLLTRSLGLAPFSACLSAVIFSFSGYLFAHLHHVSLICAASWLPLILLFIDRAWRVRLLPYAPLAAAALGAAALCGHPQTLFHVCLAVIFWLAWRLLATGQSSGEWRFGRAAAVCGLTFSLAFGLAAVQLLLTADLAAAAPHGQRGDLSYVTSFSLLPGHLRGLLSPDWQGSPAFNTYRGEPYYWEYVLYLGLLPLLLAIIGAATRRGRVWAALGLGALLLALAQGNPLYHLLRFLPGFADFRAPARFIFLYTFAAALLAAYGWEALSRLRWLAPRPRLTIVAALVALITASDLLGFARTMAPLASPLIFRGQPPVAHALRQDTTWSRALILSPITIYADWLPPGGWAENPNGWAEARGLLPAAIPQSFGIRTVGGYAGFTDPEQAPFLKPLAENAVHPDDLPLLSLVGARYLIAAPHVPVPDLPSAQVPPFVIYRNDAALPRAFAVGEIIVAPTPDAARTTTLQLAQADRLRESAVVQGDLQGLQPSRPAEAILDVEEPRPEHVLISARSDADAILVLNERWDRDWRVLIDGRPAPLLRVDSLLMGAALPSGQHTVEFVYRPRALLIGRAITLVSLALCAALILAPRSRRRADSPD